MDFIIPTLVCSPMVIKANDFDELGLKISKWAKKASKEDEVWAVEHMNEDTKEMGEEWVKSERKYKA